MATRPPGRTTGSFFHRDSKRCACTRRPTNQSEKVCRKARPGTTPFGRPVVPDVKDIFHQIAWYQSQGMLKGEFGIEQVIDRRYLLPLNPQ